MTKSDLYGALSRGYCSKKNSSKQVDPDLIEAMVEELLLLYCPKCNIVFDERECPLCVAKERIAEYKEYKRFTEELKIKLGLGREKDQ